MPRKKAAPATQRAVDLKISPPELWRFEFVRNPLTADTEIDDSPPIEFSLGLNRFSTSSIGLELTVELKNFAPLRVLASYRTIFDLEMEGSVEEIERELRAVAAQVGPSALYPYIRETISSAVAKAGLPPLVPPIVNFRSVFSPDEVTLPAVPGANA